MRRKVVLCMVLAALLACACLPHFPVYGRADEPEPITVSIGSSTGSLPVSENDGLLQYICERFNVTFDVLSHSGTDSSDYYRLLAALNSLPDILLYNPRWDLNYFIQCDALTPLPVSMAAWPNLTALISYPYALGLQVDGKIWGIPSFTYDTYSGMVDTCGIFDKQIYEAAWPREEPPSTIEDWHTLLENIQALYPQLIPLTSRSPESMFNLTYFYSPATYTWLWEGSRYIPGYYSDAFAESIRALKTLWDDGLLDPDFMNVNVGAPGGLDKFMLGNAAGVMYDNVPYLWQAEFVPTWLKTHPNESIPDSLQLVFLPGDADGNYYETYSYNMTAVCLGSSAADGRMDRILTMLDWLCSEEGSRLRRYGLEGEDYRIGSNRAIVRLNDDTSLYSKYPSYAFFRILPNQDTMAFWRDESGNALTRFVTRQFTAWREQHDVQTLFLTSIRANTVSTPAVLNFHPDIMDSAYRLLIAEDMDAQFELIRNEYRENGIESMIDSVHYHIN